jgi:protein O-GlcNAc transferase
LIQAGNHSDALSLLEKEKEQMEGNAEFLCLMGVIATRTKNQAYAIQLFERAQDLPDASADMPEVLAVLYALVGDLHKALYYAKLSTVRKLDRRVLDLLGISFPIFADAFQKIQEKPLVAAGETMLAEGRLEESINSFGQHIALNPMDEAAYDGLTRALLAGGDIMTALNMTRSLRMIAPGGAAYAARLGRILTLAGDFAEARSCYRQALALDRESIPARIGMLSDMAFDPAAPADLADKVRNELITLIQGTTPAAAKPQPQPRGSHLRVAYLVGRLSDEDEIAMIASVLQHHDRSRFELVGFGDGDLNLPHNSRFRMMFKRWLNVQGVNQRTFASMMRGEEVDVLVVVSGHQRNDVLRGLAMHVPTVQVAWRVEGVSLPSPGLDYELVDEFAAPSTAAGAPKPWKLGSGLYAFQMPSDNAANTLPFQVNRYIAFGLDASLAELNSDVAMVCARILHDVPESMLLLRDYDRQHPQTAQKILDLFGNYGVANRIDLVSAGSRRDFLQETDIQLTPFPYARPFSAAESISFGIPVIALDRPGRVCQETAHLLRRLGLAEDMVGASEDDYVAKSVAWAKNAPKREEFRLTGRRTAQASPVYDPAKLAASLEQAFDAMVAKAG